MNFEADIANQRLLNQQLSSPRCKRPDDLVQWLGAVQAQDYNGAKWALGQRLPGAKDETIEKAFSEGTILRTHVMRPTWHFVSADDIRWLLQLTAPRVNAAIASYYRKYELDQQTLRRSRKAIVTALKGGRQLTREALRNVLQEAGVVSRGIRFIFILANAELDALICSGPRLGKQFTYALLDERTPHAKVWTRDEALAELTRRYFSSHGPATLEDFAWWSGLSTADTRAGISMVKGEFFEEAINGKKYWLSAVRPKSKDITSKAYLLPTYDEYLIGYRDRSAVFDSAFREQAKAANPVFTSPIVIDGRVVGSWKRTIQRKRVLLELNLSVRLSKTERPTLAAAAECYAKFLGMSVDIAFRPQR